MDRVKVGVIGCGNISDLYLTNLTQRYGNELEVTACADIVPEKARASAQKFGIPRSLTVNELLSDPEITIVVNLTVPGAHTEVNLQILEAGKNVYCEKPFALDLVSAAKVLQKAEEKGLYCACAPDTFLGAGIQTCRQLLDEGWIGKPLGGCANFVWPGHEIWHPSPEFYYEYGGGPMMDMGPYYISSLVSMLGPVSKISCFAKRSVKQRVIYSKPLRGRPMEVEVPTHYCGAMEFTNGTVLSINFSFDVWHSHLPDMEIYGTDGSIFCPNPDLFCGPVSMLRKESVLDSIAEMDTEDMGTKGNIFDFSGFVKEMPLRYHDPLKKTRGLGILDLAHAIRDRRSPRISHTFVYHVLEILLAFEKASKSGSVYQLQSTCDRPAAIPTGLGMDKID